MAYVALFIFGSAVGSFLNVVSLRYQPNFKLLNFETLKLYVGGRSHCMHCGKTLNWYELIPFLSFLIQKAKCRFCGQKLSWQYPLVEFLSGLIFLLVPIKILNFQFSISNFQSIFELSNYQLPITTIWILIFLLFLLLSIIDFRLYIIPDSINLFLAILGIILIIFNFQFSITQLSNSFLGHYSLLFNFNLLIDYSQYSHAFVVLNRVFAAITAMSFVAAIIILSRGRGMGWGDFKLVGALGLIFGWPDILMVVFLSFIVGSIAVLPLLIKKKKTMKDAVPFGPFLIIGASLTFFFGYQIIDGYFKIFGLI